MSTLALVHCLSFALGLLNLWAAWRLLKRTATLARQPEALWLYRLVAFVCLCVFVNSTFFTGRFLLGLQ
ncbi:hypothetical protein [Hymenobacter sp. B81]|uniref:hypothetical protein n=1 Tax=Hymenobacter sp. B81 TaxID=3344878 RepID=UPI0037DC4855